MQDSGIMKTTNNDPILIYNIPPSFNNKKLMIKFEIENYSSKSNTQLFYQNKNDHFTEEESFIQEIKNGPNQVIFSITTNNSKNNQIRFDPLNIHGDFIIRSCEIKILDSSDLKKYYSKIFNSQPFIAKRPHIN